MNKLHKTVPDFTLADLLYDKEIQLFVIQIALGMIVGIMMLGLSIGFIPEPEITDTNIPLYLGISVISIMAFLGKILEIKENHK